MKTHKLQKTFTFTSYTEDSHPILYLEDEEIIYDTILKSLLINCSLLYLKRDKNNLKIPPEHSCSTPVFNRDNNITIENWREHTAWGHYLWGEIMHQLDYREVQVLPLSIDMNITDLGESINNKSKITYIYNSRREEVLAALEEIGNPRLMIELSYSFIYVYINTHQYDSTYMFYIFPRNNEISDFIFYEVFQKIPDEEIVADLAVQDITCILQMLSFELEALSKEDHDKITSALFRLIEGGQQ